MTNNADDTSSASRRQFLKIGAGVVGGLVVGAAAVYVGKPSTTSTTTVTSTQSGTPSVSTITTTLPGSTVTSTSTETSTVGSTVTSTGTGSTSTVTSTVTSTATGTATSPQNALLTLSTTESSLVEAMAEALIPTDSNGAGAKEAGVLYFIDHQLAADYGKSANMYTRGPFVQPGLTGPITVQGITYTGGSMFTIPTAGTAYQYGMLLRDFWRYGLQAFETYCNGAYGGNFEKLSSANQVKALTDLYNNVPTAFNKIAPADFFGEVFFMTWSGFLMDPLYSGNQGMVGWLLTGFNGTNQGNFYGEGMTTKQLMVASKPTRLKPASLAQFQQASGP
ncbi:MAG: gluconate 2-dehydrogenase subunit 3 family protein [Thaumarchaeota archaeon]|nr:gluconate 2-dehydrogenase subunit 3 family protein [Nitrososphaerota archaeon]